MVMTLSALVMGGTGVVLIFAPQEVSVFFGFGEAALLSAVPFQLLGALYFGFAMTNWTAKANLIGGIYGRPVAIGNLVHFMVASLALVKAYSAGVSIILLPAVVYAGFAIAFAVIFFTHPVKESMPVQ